MHLGTVITLCGTFEAASMVKDYGEFEMTAYAALLRAVNVGGTGKLRMTMLAELCREAGFEQVKTYIASGNVVFASEFDVDGVRQALEMCLEVYAGKRVGVLVRTVTELADVVKRNPFADRPGNRTVALFVDEKLSPDQLEQVTGQQGEELRLGKREIFISYDDGMADSKLRIPVAKAGTARNMNTVAKLAEMTAALV